MHLVSRVLSVGSGSRPDIGDSLVSSSTVDDNEHAGTSLGGAGVSDRPHEGLNPASNNRPRTGGSSKGAVPKWFKGTGKIPERLFSLFVSTRKYHYSIFIKPFQKSVASVTSSLHFNVIPGWVLLLHGTGNAVYQILQIISLEWCTRD